MDYEGPSVLIVDDEEDTRSLVCEQLAEEGYACDGASNGDEALAKSAMHRFVVTLLDIRLPDMSGLDLLKVMKRRHQMTAIIMTTAVNDLDTAVEAMKLGALDYIVKPFTLDKLNDSISKALCSRKQQHLVAYPVMVGGGNIYCDNALLREIDAIADGVDAQVDYFDFHSKIVTERTIELAQCLGLPGKEIETWATARYLFYSERERRIESLLSKLKRNPRAQAIPGLTRPAY
jgi:DNA-binding response OmpR family regulator